MTKYRHTKPPLEPGAPKRNPPENCPVSGKRMYPTERDAAAAAKYLMTSNENTPPHLRSYRCQYCGAFHLTSK